MTIAIITGGSRGLGKNIALNLAKNGTDILLTYNTKAAEAEAVAAEIRNLGCKAAILQLDVSDSANYGPFVEKVRSELQTTFGTTTFTYLVNNAGIGIHASFAETTEEQFDTLVNIHLKSTFFLSQKLLPFIEKGGAILNLSSGLARFSFAGYAAYGTMKGAIDTLTRYMAQELGPRGIRVNSLAPGAIETDFGGGMVRDNAEMNKQLAAQTPLGRVGLPDDIGSAAAAILSANTGWITGQRIEASGGFQL